jgi:putative transposase
VLLGNGETDYSRLMSHWPHAPSHEVTHPGAYILTAATLHKAKVFDSPEKLDMLEDLLLQVLAEKGWRVQAWAVFPNHYHFVGLSPDTGIGLTSLTREVHSKSARALNEIDGNFGRKVWYRCWDTRLSFEKSYLARLAYVHKNPVKHGLVSVAENYKWCSARWFATRANRPFYESVMSFKTDRVNVYDDF